MISAVALPAHAQDSAVIDGLPIGTLVYDADAGVAASAAPIIDSPVVDAAPIQEPMFALPTSTQAPASTRSPAILPPVTTGTVLDPGAIAPQIDLAPGETILQAIAVPSVVKVPAPEPVYTLTSNGPGARRAAPTPKVDPVTGRLRDTPGWTGRREAPASIGCFPEGACAVLNQQ